MRNVTLFPFGRSAFSLDRVLEDNFFVEPGPAYDLIRIGEHQSRLVFAVPGYSRDELDVEQDGLELVVRSVSNEGETAPKEEENIQYVRRGIARAAFERRFRLSEHVRVVGADLSLGLLTVDLVRETPEALKPRKIDIGNQKSNTSLNDGHNAQAA